MKKRQVLIFLFVIFCCLSIVVITFIGRKKTEQNYKAQMGSPAEYYQQGETYLKSGRYTEAYDAFKTAVNLAPENPEYHWRVSRLAVMFKDTPLARQHTDLAWEKGMRTPALAHALIRLNNQPEAKKHEYALSLLEQFPDSPEKEELHGDVLGLLGQHDKAYDIWKSVAMNSPSDIIVAKIARASLFLQKQNEATEFIQSLWEKNQLGPMSFNILASLYIFSDAYEDADKLFSEAKISDWFDDNLRLKYAYYRFAKGMIPEVQQILHQLIQAKDQEKHDRLIPARHNARILLSFLWAMNPEDKSNIQMLRQMAKEELSQAALKIEVIPWIDIAVNARRLEGEILFHDFLVNRPSDPGVAFETITKINHLIPDHPVVQLQYARECISYGKLDEGLSVFNHAESIPGFKKMEGVSGLFYQSPIFIIDLAKALAIKGDTENARLLLGWLHQKKIATKASLQLFRDLSILEKDIVQAEKTQTILETIYPNDRELKLEGAALYSTTNNLDNALTILDELIENEPGNKDLKLAKMIVYLRKKEFSRVISECDQFELPKDQQAIIKARAYSELGQQDKAEVLFRIAAEHNPSPAVQAEYAQFLLSTGKTAMAMDLLLNVLKNDPNNHAALIELSSISLSQNNMAQAQFYLKKMMAAKVPDIHIFMAQAKMALLTNNLDNAEGYLLKILQIDPENAEAKYLRAMTIVDNAGKWQNDFEKNWAYKKAENIFNTHLASHPDDIRMMTGLLHLKLVQKKFDEALLLTNDILMRKPDMTMVFAKRFDVYLILKQFDRAEKTLNNFKPNLLPTDYSIYLASLYNAKGDSKKAQSILEPHLNDPTAALRWATYAIISNPNEKLSEVLSGQNYDPNVWATLGTLALENNNFKISRLCYDKAIEKAPDNGAFLNNYAWSCINLDNFDQKKALAAAKKASRLLIQRPEVKDTYITLLNKCGMFEESIKILGNNKKTMPTFPPLLYQLAVAYENTGEIESALTTYDRLLNSDKATWPKNIQENEIIAKIDVLKTGIN